MTMSATQLCAEEFQLLEDEESSPKNEPIGFMI